MDIILEGGLLTGLKGNAERVQPDQGQVIWVVSPSGQDGEPGPSIHGCEPADPGRLRGDLPVFLSPPAS
jgi:hypothetical protein